MPVTTTLRDKPDSYTCASMYLTASPTVRILSASSSGMTIPNSSSKSHHQFHRVQRVGAEILNEGGLFGHFLASTPSCSVTMFFTLSAISIFFSPPIFRTRKPGEPEQRI